MTVQKGFSKRDFSCGQYDREYQAAQTDISSRGMIYSRNLISSPLREIKTRPGTAIKTILQDETYMVPYRYGDQDLLLLFSDKKLGIYEFLADNSLVPFLGQINIQEFKQDWTANTTNGYTVSSSDNSAYRYKSFNNSYEGWSGGEGYEISFSAPEAFVLNKFFVSWDASYGRTTSSEPASGPQFKGLKKARIMYSDDGVSWFSTESVLTKTDGTSGINEYQSVYTSGIQPPKFISVRSVIEYYVTPLEKERHKYWKMIFSEYVEPGTPYRNLSSGVKVGVYTGTLSQNVVFNTEIGIEDLRNIKYAQNELELKIATGTTKPYRFAISNGTIQFEQFLPDNTIWTTYGLPSCVCYFQNRLWWGGFSGEPTGIIGSKFGDDDNYTVPSTIDASSPIIAICNQIKTRITDLFAGQDVLYAQCKEGIAIVESGNAAIAPNNMSFSLKINKRSSGITPTVKDNLLFFVSESKDNIYVIQFDLIADKYQISNVNTFSNSFLRAGIKEIHYVDTEARLIYGILFNGQMFALLYDSQAAVVGLFPFNTTGNILDIAVAETAAGLRLMGVVQRGRQYVVEMFNPVIDLESTTDFSQTRYAANEATKRNLMKQPYIDGAISYKDERAENWHLDAGAGILSATDSGEHTNFSQHPQETIRFFTSENSVFDLKIVGSPASDQYNVEIIEGAGDADFVSLQMPITSYTPDLLIPNQEYQYFDSGRYMGGIKATDTGALVFEKPVYDLIYGFGYTKIGVIQDNMTYLRKKKWGTIALNVMDTMSLQIGTKLDKMDNVMKWKGTDFFKSSPIMRNGILIKNISDSPENDKQLIFKTDEGLPFCIRAIEAGGEITDRNGN